MYGFFEICIIVAWPCRLGFGYPTDCTVLVAFLLLPRYVLYGLEGCGKSVSLAHLINYGWQEGFIVITFPWVR